MASRATQALTTGMKILGGANIPTYTLEFLSNTVRHKQGTFQTIVMPFIELGRDKNCAVCFGDDAPTVSRKHASIERKGTDLFIRNLSQTNQTLVNGRPVISEQQINNGDEIQLSLEGPRLRYNQTQSGTARMGFTSKMNLVMQQAIRPYKTAALSLLALFIAVSATAGYFIYSQGQEITKMEQITMAQADSIAAINQKNMELAGIVDKNKAEFQQRLAAQQVRLREEAARNRAALDSSLVTAGGKTYVQLIEPVKNYTLAIFETGIKVEFNGEIIAQKSYEPDCMCTGFMLEGGLFVTARHCVDAGLTGDDFTNFIEHSGGKTTYYYQALSFDGKINFTFTNHDLKQDKTKDKLEKVTLQGMSGAIRIPDYFTGADWAYMQTSYSAGMPFDKSFSQTLPSGTELLVLGYSYGMKYRKSGTLEPYFSTAKVALSGVQAGTINVSEAGWDGGNSGGPVLAVKNGKAYAIGLVTGTYRKPERTSDGKLVWINAGIKMVTPVSNF